VVVSSKNHPKIRSFGPRILERRDSLNFWTHISNSNLAHYCGKVWFYRLVTSEEKERIRAKYNGPSWIRMGWWAAVMTRFWCLAKPRKNCSAQNLRLLSVLSSFWVFLTVKNSVLAMCDNSGKQASDKRRMCSAYVARATAAVAAAASVTLARWL